MKKLIKSYFLFLAESPVWYNFIAWAIFFLTYLSIECFIQGNTTISLNGKLIIIVTIILIINTIIVNWIRKKYITTTDDDSDYLSYLFTVLITNDGKKIVLKKPIWKKGEKTIITCAKSLTDDIEKEFSFYTSVSGKFYNTNINIPVKIELRLEDNFNELEVFNELIKNLPKSKVLDITDYFIKMFDKINKNNQKDIEKEIFKFAKQEISESQLLNQVTNFINFPEKPLSNVKNVNIYLEKPEITSCKGVSCPG